MVNTKKNSADVFIKLIPEDSYQAEVSDFCLLYTIAHFLQLSFLFKETSSYQGYSSCLLVWLGIFFVLFLFCFLRKKLFMHKSPLLHGLRVARNKTHLCIASPKEYVLLECLGTIFYHITFEIGGKENTTLKGTHK